MKNRAARKLNPSGAPAAPATQATDLRWRVRNAATGESTVVSARDAAGAISWALKKCSRVARASNDGELLTAERPAEPKPLDERTLAICGLMRRYVRALDSLNDWRAKLAASATGADVAYELEWGAGAFAIAAEAKVLQGVIRAVWMREDGDDALSLDALREHARKEALRGAKYPACSTSSACSNLLKECETAAWAELSELLDREVMS